MELTTEGVKTRDVITLGSGVVTVKGLTLGEQQAVATAEGGKGNAVCLALATGATVESVLSFLENAPGGDVKVLLEAVYELSGLATGAQFPG